MIINANKIKLIPINECNIKHLEHIKKSLLKKGYDGESIYYSSSHNKLVTGSHRYEACKALNIEAYFENIDDLILPWLYANDFEFDDINFEEINNYGYNQLEKYFRQYDDDYKYGECEECGSLGDVRNNLCIECAWIYKF